MTTQEKNKDNNNPIKKIFSRLKPTLRPVLVFALALALFSFVCIKEYKKVEILKKQKSMMLNNIKQKNEVFKKVKKYNVENSSFNVNDLKKFKNILPESNIMEQYIASINKISNISTSRVILSDFSVKEPEEVSLFVNGKNLKLKKVDFNFSIKSNFSNFSNFIDSLEKNVPLLNLDKIEIRKISAENGNGGGNFINSNIDFSFYFI